jgi:hypothetical protein
MWPAMDIFLRMAAMTHYDSCGPLARSTAPHFPGPEGKQIEKTRIHRI